MTNGKLYDCNMNGNYLAPDKNENILNCISIQHKTEVMVISKKNCTPTCNIVKNGTVLKQVHKFNYFGSLITSDDRCINEIKRRMAQAKASFQNMKSILTNVVVVFVVVIFIVVVVVVV